jgi:hypothetical protein
LFRRPDVYDPKSASIPTTGSFGDCSLRSGLLEQLHDVQFLEALSKDRSIVLWAILRRIAVEWQAAIDSHEYAIQAGAADDFHFTDDNWMIWNTTDATTRCQNDLKMLKESYNVIESGGPTSLRYLPGTPSEEVVGNLKADFADLIDRTEKCITGYRHRIAVMAAVRSIHESEKAIKQSSTIR